MKTSIFKVTKKHVEDDGDQWLITIVIDGKKYPRQHGYLYCYPKPMSKKSAIDNALISVGLEISAEDIQENVKKIKESIELERKLSDQLHNLNMKIANYDLAIKGFKLI